MATVTDVEVANASFPTVRQDLNDILEAIATNFSADAEPTTTYANQWWYETDTDKLYIRNEANDAWIHVLTLDQTGNTVSGVEGAGDADAISEGNSSVEVIDTGTGYIQFNVDGAEVARIDSDGMKFGDNEQAIFGAGSDLKIFHDGAGGQSYIQDVGTGDLNISSNGAAVKLLGVAGSNMVVANSGGSVNLYHNTSQKLATASGGVTITGTCTATSFSGDGSALTGISGGGKILQVVQAIDTINRSMTFAADTWHTVPNLTATITPSATSSKILMMARIFFEWDAGDMWNLNYAPARGGSQFNISTTTMSSPATNAQNRAMGSVFSTENANDTFTTPEGIVFSTIDSPNTTSATSYTVQMINTNNGGSMYFNSTVSLSNPNAVGMTSEIILMEIGA